MNSDDFEQHLKRTPLTPLPPEWKRDILAAARAARETAAVTPHRVADDPADLREAVAGWWRRLRSPWSLLAAGWVVVVTLHAASARLEVRPAPASTVAEVRSSRSSILLAARQHRAEVLALVNADEPADLEPPPELSAPRSGEPRPRGQWLPGRKGLRPRVEPEPLLG